MPIQQFRTYDLIVDIAPGALALVLPILLIPQAYASTIGATNGFLASVILLLGGFLAGRLLHAVSGKLTRALSGIGPVQSDDESLIEIIKHGKTLATQTDESDTENNEDGSPDDDAEIDLPEDIDPTVVSTAITSLHDRMTDGHTDPTPEASRRYGESLLYDKPTLHHRYEILTTFYRSLAVLLFVTFIPYIIYAALAYTNIVQTPASALLYFAVAVSIMLLALLASSRYSTFTHRRNHAFINDIHRYLNEDT